MTKDKKGEEPREDLELTDQDLEDVNGGAQTVHLKMQIDGNDIVGESEATTLDRKEKKKS